MKKTLRLPNFECEVELGKFAQQADGSAWVKQGGTVVLATVVSAAVKDFPGFLPLTVDYREQFAAAGKIPGGYYKREGKYTDKEVLTARLIDRTIRPLFPATYFNQMQALATVYSVDKQHQPHILALLGTSLALTISKIPFMGPVGVVEVARVAGEWIYFPTYQQAQASDVRLIIAGTKEGLCMVEGGMAEVQESDLIDVFFKAHDFIKQQVAWQEEIAQEYSVAKEPIAQFINWDEWNEKVTTFLTQERVATTFKEDKVERVKAREAITTEFKELYKADIELQGVEESIVEYVFDARLKEKLTDLIMATKKRIDGRSFAQVRSIQTEVGLLPFNHGSALFKRGRTQALASVTLGGGQDEQKVEDLMGATVEKTFMLHYNFPPFSVGEVRAMRGPGRREVGHGHLAASALEFILPDREKFPYTTRIVCDILESDGSSSMATTCSAVMALMNAGVPIKKMVSGVAMGLLESQGQFQALTDINGIEDEFGLMDFKVTGTSEGVTAIQMDIKYKGGLKRSVFEAALAQAKEGRLHILKEMQKVMTEPSKELSSLVPQFTSFKVPVDKIGAIIGSGGKVIKEIIAKTETTIDIDDDGTVHIFGQPGPNLDKAVMWVKTLGGIIDRGAIYNGIIRRITDFGLFVELVPGQDGLVHISQIPREQQRDIAKLYPVGSELPVEVAEYDAVTGRIRLIFVRNKA
jgi:polyribonucleotide nucleotidyltransferase